ncbi:MAG: hypothetical protein WCK35_26040, partial [Chloroflexota bacterium]
YWKSHSLQPPKSELFLVSAVPEPVRLHLALFSTNHPKILSFKSSFNFIVTAISVSIITSLPFRR